MVSPNRDLTLCPAVDVYGASYYGLSVSGALHATGITFTSAKDVPDAGDFGLVDTPAGGWIVKGDERCLAVADVRIPGRHNLANALAALALGDAVGLPMQAMVHVLREFQGLPHRTQWVADCQGVRWFNDSKATNTGAVIAALDQLADDSVVLIAGGRDKGEDYTLLRDTISRKVKNLIVIGEVP